RRRAAKDQEWVSRPALPHEPRRGPTRSPVLWAHLNHTIARERRCCAISEYPTFTGSVSAQIPSLTVLGNTLLPMGFFEPLEQHEPMSSCYQSKERHPSSIDHKAGRNKVSVCEADSTRSREWTSPQAVSLRVVVLATSGRLHQRSSCPIGRWPVMPHC